MKYILTRNEYDELKNTYFNEFHSMRQKLNEVCKMYAESAIWLNGVHPKGCSQNNTVGNCTGCPVYDYCLYENKRSAG